MKFGTKVKGGSFGLFRGRSRSKYHRLGPKVLDPFVICSMPEVVVPILPIASLVMLVESAEACLEADLVGCNLGGQEIAGVGFSRLGVVLS